jgi:hypothetical protein
LELVEFVELIFPPKFIEEIDVIALKFKTLLTRFVVKFVVDVVVTEVNTSSQGDATKLEYT